MVAWTLAAPTFCELELDSRFENTELDLDGIWTHGAGHWSIGGMAGTLSFVLHIISAAVW